MAEVRRSDAKWALPSALRRDTLMRARRPLASPALVHAPARTSAVVAGMAERLSRPLHSVGTIDCHYAGADGYGAAYLLHEGDRAAFVDNNTNHVR